MAHRIFLSYRRSDTAGHAGRISGDLARRFGPAIVFRDMDSISAGTDFIEALKTAIRQARVAVVLIGNDWLNVTSDDGKRRLERPDDHVRREVELALENPSLTVVPVLVEGAKMPSDTQLPESLKPLARLQAIELSEQRWDYDIERLIEVLRGAGVRTSDGRRVPRWLLPVLLALLAAAIAAVIWCWQSSVPGGDRYTGLWYLPNGSFWTVREDDAGFWVEETHHQSRQVWKRGGGKVDGDGFEVALELVFDREPFHYLHRLRLSRDRQTLLGTVRRSDSEREVSLALTRNRP